MKGFVKVLREVKDKSEVILFLLIISLIGAFIEFTYGSIHIGLVFFIICLLLLVILIGKSARETRTLKSPIFPVTGMVLIVADLSYNYLSGSQIQTLDSMVLLLGASLLLMSSRKNQYSEIGTFGACLSVFFLCFFMLLYTIPSELGIRIPAYYGHYFVALPVYGLLTMLGLNLELPALGLITVNGVELASLKMDLACFGWYSMFLIISTLLAYTLVIERYEWNKFLKILFVMVGASYAANFLRVTTLIVLTYYYGIETMMRVHSHLGWVLFALILMPLLYHLLNQENQSSSKV